MHAVIGVEVDLLVFVTPSTLAIHGDPDATALEQAGEGVTRKLTALVGIEYRGRAPAGHGLLHGIHAKLHIHGVGQPPSQNLAVVPIDLGEQVHPSFVHAHVGDVNEPDLIGMSHGLMTQQVWVDLVLPLMPSWQYSARTPMRFINVRHACDLRSSLDAATNCEAYGSPQRGE